MTTKNYNGMIFSSFLRVTYASKLFIIPHYANCYLINTYLHLDSFTINYLMKLINI